MSNRTKLANKAVQEAWEKEKSLVQEGKGTRDWTIEQQQQLITKGKVYDEDGKAFAGHHMKNVEHYPEYQGDPNNIQFLSPREHMAAHACQGGTRFPCNGYYDYNTGSMKDFGDTPPVPCKIITLSESILYIEEPNYSAFENIEKKQFKKNDALKEPREQPKRINPSALAVSIEENEKPLQSLSIKPPKSEKSFSKSLKDIGRFILQHPSETFEVVILTAKAVSLSKGLGSKLSNSRPVKNRTSSASSVKSDSTKTVANVKEKAKRSSPRKHEVSSSSQRYHTKNGIIWKRKEPYPRGGKNCSF